MASFQQSGKKGLWSVRFRIIENGKEVNKRLSGYKTKKEANTAYMQYLKDFDKHEAELKSKNGKILFKDVYQNFFENSKSKLKESTIYDINSICNLYIVPHFGEKYIQDITPRDILEWQNTLISHSYNYRSRIRRHLGSIFNFAERYYDIDSPMRKVESFRDTEPKKEMSFWTMNEFNQFISVADNDIYKVFFSALYISGCRRGELLALNIDDLDFERSTITISKSITNKGEGAWKVVTPKNKSSNRTIDMPQKIMEQMKELHEKYKGDFIFCGERPLPTTSIDRYLLKYCKKSGVKKIRVHDFRHSCASLLISQGVSIVAVSKRLGHSDIEQTLNTYSHMMPSDVDMMKSAINNIYKDGI